ncbi:MAG: restriction endonuclease [Desulfobacterales bacterium]|jgi:restriction system protein|nr:restriction endonuclease [Desulfobacterales bacterium]
MAIPDYQTILLPMLRMLADGKERTIDEAVAWLTAEFEVPDDERRQLLGGGRQTIIRNRAGWARTYLKKAGLIASRRRGMVHITDRGRSVLGSNPERIDLHFLMQFPEFAAFRRLGHERAGAADPAEPGASGVTPEESLETAYQRLRFDLEADLLEQVQTAPATIFERLVVDLLVRMGYGGSVRDAGRAVGKTGDGGIEGIIDADPLGLDVVYIQAKRGNASVGRPEIQKFAGALFGHGARKGVFLTTAAFADEAIEYVARIDANIVLIDGPALARFMTDYSVGVSTTRAYLLKRIDSDYFSEE